MAQVEGSALVAQAIQREGIEVLFGLAGGPIQDIMGFAPHCGVRPIGVHHEQAATFAAAAYGYVKNQLGVAVLAAGPGVTNGVTGAHVATAEMRGSHMPQLMNMLRERAATQPAASWLQRLVEADIPCTLVQDYDMLVQDPQALENGYLYHYEHPRFGTLQAVGPVASFSKTDPVPQGPAPGEPGQHTQAILANAGFTADEIGQLRANKVVS